LIGGVKDFLALGNSYMSWFSIVGHRSHGRRGNRR
jgi:hypothetical protein